MTAHAEDRVPGAACASCGVSRRTFLSAATLAAVAAVLDGCSQLTGPSGFGAGGGTITVKLSSYPVLANVGGVARVDGGNGSPTALVRTSSSTFTALSMICTHQGFTIDIAGSGFICPNHGAQYSKTGAWIGGQPASQLQGFAATYDATAGTVVIARPS
ncbi:MAG: Rieske (2Fe-2S) protein [Gemmatimonadetes bacterium]|nr:Rieske (2Fe-2S) protein [Gemmatimonadota bacterium]